MPKLVHGSRFMVHGETKAISLGFTLVEVLVVLGILSIVVGSSLIFLTSVIKGTNQANVTAEVKQNGQIVFDTLERQVRNATNVQIISTNFIKLIRSGKDPLYLKCFPSVSETSNGWIGTSVRSESAIPPTPADVDFTSLTNNTDLVSGVDIVCSTGPPGFDVIPSSSTAPPIVTINFTVNQGIKAPSRQDFVANAQFQTTISLRQY